LEQLKELQSQYEDFGPVYDCVVFHDGNVWRSVIDLDESGDLTGSVVLTDYFREHQISTFGHNSMLNFAINIYEEGNVLSIVTSGSWLANPFQLSLLLLTLLSIGSRLARHACCRDPGCLLPR